MQRKVSHILVKRDQENLLDEIEDRLAGVYDQSERILTRYSQHSIFAVATLSEISASEGGGTEVSTDNIILCKHVAGVPLSVQEAVLPLSSIPLCLLPRATLW